MPPLQHWSPTVLKKGTLRDNYQEYSCARQSWWRARVIPLTQIFFEILSFQKMRSNVFTVHTILSESEKIVTRTVGMQKLFSVCQILQIFNKITGNGPQHQLL